MNCVLIEFFRNNHINAKNNLFPDWPMVGSNYLCYIPVHLLIRTKIFLSQITITVLVATMMIMMIV